MKRRSWYKRGAAIEEVVILVGLLIIIFLFVIPGEYPSFYNSSDTSGNSSAPTSSEPGQEGDSAYSRWVVLGSGDASSFDHKEEYITITNNLGAPVNVTGWKLSGTRGTFSLPRAFPPNETRSLKNAELAPGESVRVITGPRSTSRRYFSATDWRMFLNKDYEIWSVGYESIRLYDRLGKLVDTLTY